ncbi:hypothetical protein [Haloflavibacter putidus]|uniref:hypothetical protein n=1 Tax=Haloflavibacter putidus TaxID=2576776 RepID=UPI001F3DFE22|nr:hypothetical protein [Haloflavibacter putidus]
MESCTKWNSVFGAGNYYKTENFAQGNKIHLLTPNGEGMYSILDKIIENVLVFLNI